MRQRGRRNASRDARSRLHRRQAHRDDGRDVQRRHHWRRRSSSVDGNRARRATCPSNDPIRPQSERNKPEKNPKAAVLRTVKSGRVSSASAFTAAACAWKIPLHALPFTVAAGFLDSSSTISMVFAFAKPASRAYTYSRQSYCLHVQLLYRCARHPSILAQRAFDARPTAAITPTRSIVIPSIYDHRAFAHIRPSPRLVPSKSTRIASHPSVAYAPECL